MRTTAPAALLLAALAACSGSILDGGPEIDRNAARTLCAQPAALHGTPDPRAPGQYLVVYEDGTPVPATTARLAQKYGFEPRFVWEHALLGFAATLTDQAVAGIRCEPEVKYLEHEAVLTIDG